jgi:hypothetical protein
VLIRTPPTSTASATTQLLDLLADPATADLSNRELGRRVGLHHLVVAGFRMALDPAGDGGHHRSNLDPAPAAAASRPWHTPSTPGHSVAFERPALNALDCWALATEVERAKFVDAVGLDHLLAVAPADHRDAFLRSLIAQRFLTAPSPRPAQPKFDISDGLDIPNVLRRIREPTA